MVQWLRPATCFDAAHNRYRRLAPQPTQPECEREIIRRRRSKPSGETPKRRDIRVSLSEIIEAGILTAPLPLFRKYKGQELHATLQPDGAVEFGGTRYDDSSRAAEAVRETVAGRKMNTNGWTFWRYQTPSGDRRSLADARSDFIAQKPQTTA